MISYNHSLIDPQLKDLPDTPGVYIYKNKDGEIIYVGKAVNLKKRVSQYFRRDDALGPKTSSLVSQITFLEHKTVSSEIEALILEAALIKKHRPKFNSLLKDDRSYIYITISKDKLPIIRPAFKSKLKDNAAYYGPFPSGSSVKTLLKTLRRIFPFYTTRHSDRECLYCHIGLCPGPQPNPKAYRRNISKIKKILNGNIHTLLRQLNKQMSEFSRAEEYEKAASVRNQIDSLNYIISGWRSINHLYQQVDLPEDNQNKTLAELKSVLLPYFPTLNSVSRIEAYDISNLGSKYFVGSMVVSEEGKINHNQYRKFKIYSKVTPDDQFMIKEIVWRRLKHAEWSRPQIILVDGGKPQVSSVSQIFSILEIKDIALIGLAKKQETIVIKHPTGWVEINLPANSPSLRHLQSLRDEAHRFANRYRRELIKLNFTK